MVENFGLSLGRPSLTPGSKRKDNRWCWTPSNSFLNKRVEQLSQFAPHSVELEFISWLKISCCRRSQEELDPRHHRLSHRPLGHLHKAEQGGSSPVEGGAELLDQLGSLFDNLAALLLILLLHISHDPIKDSRKIVFGGEDEHQLQSSSLYRHIRVGEAGQDNSFLICVETGRMAGEEGLKTLESSVDMGMMSRL